jgi:hypothetical protein
MEADPVHPFLIIASISPLFHEGAQNLRPPPLCSAYIVFGTGQRERFLAGGWIRSEDIRWLRRDKATGEECPGGALPVRYHGPVLRTAEFHQRVVTYIDPIRGGLVYED